MKPHLKTIIAAATAATTLAAAPAAAQGEPLTLHAALTGEAEVGPGDPDAMGGFVAMLYPDRDYFCYSLVTRDAAMPTAAHIHEGMAGVDGGPVIPLEAPSDGSSAGCAPIDSALTGKLTANPSGYYVNVHNAEYPKGALRGQLMR